MSRSILLIIVVLNILVAGCATTKDDFYVASKQDSVLVYEDFLKNHPNSEFDKQVKARLEDLRSLKAGAERKEENKDTEADRRTINILHSYKAQITLFADFKRDFSMDDYYKRSHALGIELSSEPGMLHFISVAGHSEGTTISEMDDDYTGAFMFGRYIVKGRAVRFSEWDWVNDSSPFVPAIYLHFSKGTLDSIRFLTNSE